MLRRARRGWRAPAAVWLALGFGALARAEEIPVPGGVVDLQWSGPAPAAQAGAARQWVMNSARAVATYYRTIPVRRVVLRLTPGEGDKVGEGMTSGYHGALMEISVGRRATSADLARDWVLTHEMLHVSFPNLPEQHHWLEEGLATYVEPMARARAGLLSPAEAWSDLFENLPQGLPMKGDRGLDHTHTWGRTYYGGALYCLRADMEIRRRTGNRRGLEHALRAIAAAGGNIEDSWSIERVIATGDKATGVGVLRELYDEMKATPVRVDLSALWKQLGISKRGQGLVFDDTAPLAAARKAITGG